MTEEAGYQTWADAGMAEGAKAPPPPPPPPPAEFSPSHGHEPQAGDAPVKEPCESCGYGMGRRDMCPHCGARARPRIKVGVAVLASLLLVVAAGGMFLLADLTFESDITRVEDITPNDNFRHVRLVGTVAGIPTYYEQKYSDIREFAFYLNDTTGQIKVKCMDDLTRHLKETGSLPGPGDNVDVEGTLFVSESFMNMRVSSGYFFRMDEREYRSVPIAELEGTNRTGGAENALVEVSGRVSYVNRLDFATIVELEDDLENSVSMFLPEGMINLTDSRDEYGTWVRAGSISLGDFVRVRGGLVWYDSRNDAYDGWEVVPASMDDVELVDDTGFYASNYVLYDELDLLLAAPEQRQKALVRLEGLTVDWVGEYTFGVTDDSTVATLTVYPEGRLMLDVLDEGDVIDIQGLFTTYYGQWEIKVRSNTQDSMALAGIGGGG